MEEVTKLKNDILKLKAVSKTVGDSATAYQLVVNLGDNPTADNIMYDWSVEVEALCNFDNAIFLTEAVGGYMFMTYGGGTNKSPYVNRLFPYVDINNPALFHIQLYYYNPDYVEIHGKNRIAFTSNVPFQVKSTSRRSIQLY